jgi:hypothetical protein
MGIYDFFVRLPVINDNKWISMKQKTPQMWGLGLKEINHCLYALKSFIVKLS